MKIMKKIITLLIAATLLTALAVSASAATEKELINKFKEVSISRYVLTEVENLAAAYEITEEQGDLLMDLIDRLKVAFPEDKGPGYANPEGYEDILGPEKYPYTEEQLETFLEILTEGCDILGFTYEFVTSEDPKHAGDTVVIIKDTNGRIAFQYDGDVIKKLGEIEANKNSSAPLLIGGVSVLALAGLSVVFVAKKKEQE